MSTDLLVVPPGEVLLEEFLRPMGISQYRLALAIGVPESRIYTIAMPFLRPHRRLLASHDLKLAKQALGGVLPSIEPFQPT
jgi:plasmid maintenance system antidote protein VapI